MLFNPIHLILINTLTNRFHPILYVEDLSFIGQKDGIKRWKSKGHHTSGFDTRQEAVDFILSMNPKLKENLNGGNVYFSVDENYDMEWNGQGIPAIKTLFDLDKLTIYKE